MAIIEGRESSNLVSLLCTIRRILVSALSDVDKERLIENTFMNYSQLNIQECVELVALAFSMILSDNMEGKNSAGWCILRSLEHSQQSILADVIDVSVVESLFTDYFNSPNVGEVPSLVSWCLKNGVTPVLEPIVREHVVEFSRHAHCRNSLAGSDLLSSMAVMLENHLACIPSGPVQLTELCQAMIRKLATLEMPRDSAGVALFISNIRNVEKLLKVIADHTSDRRQLSAMYLRILYATVSDSVKYPDPSPALATILQVVDVDIINGSVQSILSDQSDNESIIRLMTMLCGWLVKWPRANHVNRWILSLISKLEEENRTDILQAVVELNIESLFNALLLPTMRPGVLPVVLRLLPVHCASAEVFHKIVPRIPIVILQLRREKNNPVSCDDLRAVLNITAQCMHVFPGHRQLYEPVIRVHEVAAVQACWQDKSFAGSPTSNAMSSLWRLSPPPPAARCGLHNLGNTCYMNSVLQALFMTHKFCTAVLDSEMSDRYQPVLCGLQRLFALLLHSRRPAISAEDLLNLTRPPGFSPGHQQDSSEFLIYLLDVLHEQEKNLRNQKGSEKENADQGHSSSSSAQDDGPSASSEIVM
ncbi:Ubiquitin carboxyl-terminal hydrolase puf [Gryllus bimaculatus]|nr:Ubiquitin carboxyl-terminal hydrolase puf [Gryllus bimaculatus]